MTNQQARTTKITETARRLFVETGYAEVSMEAIARESGVSKATLYLRFASKESLFETVVRDEMKQMFRSMDQILDETLSVSKALHEYAFTLFQLISAQQHLHLTRLISQESKRFPQHAVLYYESGPERGLKHLAGYLRLHLDPSTDQIMNAEIMAEQLFNLILGSVHRQETVGVPYVQTSSDEKKVMYAVDAFLRAYPLV